ncbi:uncharacterized protein [Temnothorax nylanderi]|uniref:uncharacterized protein n=1 Tax=Temnothorax nylanderi TaxID=102681 RepID=UPI003A841D73
MVVLSGSSSRSAWFFLIALVTIIYRSAGEPSQLIGFMYVGIYDFIGRNLVNLFTFVIFTFFQDTSLTPSILMNVPVDILLKIVINYIKQNKKSIIKIPGVIKTCNIGLGIECHFETDNGIFEDLLTLERTEDAVMFNIGRTHIIQTGFKLSMAKFKYDYYKLEVGPITVSGNILGTVDGLAIRARLVIDYDKTCGVNLEYVKVTEFGKLNLEMTGLGPLNSLASTVFTGLTEKIWQDEIVKTIEVNVRNIAEKQLSEFIC